MVKQMGTSPLAKTTGVKNGTVTPIMSARQTGKSVFANTVSQAWVNDWDLFEDDRSEKPPEYLEYNGDPLALVCAMLRTNKDYSNIKVVLEGSATLGNRMVDIVDATNDQDRERATKIRRHFRNKILMRRMKNKNISKFMLAVDELLETPQRINKEHILPLMKLPDFYEEDKATEAIFNAHTSLPARPLSELDCEIEYVGTVQRRNSRSKLDIQYWRTPNNYLMRVELPLQDMGKSAWEFFAKQQKIKIKASNGGTCKVIGYDFFVYHLGLNYEIEQNV